MLKCANCGHIPHPGGTCNTGDCSCNNSQPVDGKPDGIPTSDADPNNAASVRLSRIVRSSGQFAPLLPAAPPPPEPAAKPAAPVPTAPSVGGTALQAMKDPTGPAMAAIKGKAESDANQAVKDPAVPADLKGSSSSVVSNEDGTHTLTVSHTLVPNPPTAQPSAQTASALQRLRLIRALAAGGSMSSEPAPQADGPPTTATLNYTLGAKDGVPVAGTSGPLVDASSDTPQAAMDAAHSAANTANQSVAQNLEAAGFTLVEDPGDVGSAADLPDPIAVVDDDDSGMSARRGKFVPTSPVGPGVPAAPDAASAVSQLQSLLDEAVSVNASLDFDGLPPQFQSFVALINGANAQMNNLVSAIGDPAYAVPIAESVDASIVAAREAIDGQTVPNNLTVSVDLMRECDQASGQVLAALGAPDPDVEGGTDPSAPPAPPVAAAAAASRGARFVAADAGTTGEELQAKISDAQTAFDSVSGPPAWLQQADALFDAANATIGHVTGGDDDSGEYAEATDAAIDAALQAVAGQTSTDPNVQTVLAAYKAADAASDALLTALKLPDYDRPGEQPATPPAPPAVAASSFWSEVGGTIGKEAYERTRAALAASGVNLAQFAGTDGLPGMPGGGAGAPIEFSVPVMVLEGVDTGDGRYITPGALSWRELPIPLMAVTETGDGHDGAQVAGKIELVERFDASELLNPKTNEPYGMVESDGEQVPVQALRATGQFANLEAAMAVVELIRGGYLRGVSVDMSDLTSEVEMLGDPDTPSDDEPQDLLDALFMDGDMRDVVTAGRVMGATVCPFPAFEGAFIQIGDLTTNPGQNAARPSESRAIRVVDEYGERECVPCGQEGAVLVASAGPLAPPKSWFSNPGLEGPTPQTITDDGRIFGHLATWGTCHVGIQGRCITPPHSRRDYAYFRTGSLRTAEGELVDVGRLTMDTGHAPTSGAYIDAKSAVAHYDNTGMVFADVAVGEDKHGIWFAGAMRPDVDELQVRRARASALSGDWRMVGGGLEMVAALAVNSPGYPVVRAHVASGTTTALVAAGSVGAPVVAGEPDQLADLIQFKQRVDGLLPGLLRSHRFSLRSQVHGR